MNTNTNFQPVKDLVLNIDLRVEQNVRIAKIAGIITSLKEEIGTYHVSANLAYTEDKQNHYLNLPVYVTETEQERRIAISFPEDVSVTIWKDNAEARINFLEYYLDKKTEIISEKSGIKSDRNTVIQLSIDLNLMEDNDISSEAIISDLQNQASKIHDWTKPIEFTLIHENIKYSLETISNTRTFNNSNQLIEIKYYLPEKLSKILLDNALNIRIIIRNEEFSNIYIGYINEINKKVIFLYENNDGIITTPDNDSIHKIYSENWNIFEEEIIKGNVPVIYLCTPTSERYYPASYNFTVNPDTSNINGTLEISYYKRVNGQLELWVEERDFNTSLGIGSIYEGSDSSGESHPTITKVNLGSLITP